MQLNPSVAGLIVFSICLFAGGAAGLSAKPRNAEPVQAPVQIADSHALKLSAARPSRSVKAILLAADEGCTDSLPHACVGANMCCETPSEYYCQNYQGSWEAMRGRSGCVKSGTSDEALKDYSTNCQVFTRC